MLKVYGITGRTVAIVRVPVGDGKAFLQCEFRRGRMSAGIHNRPATYATSNPVEQDIIENCDSFKSGSIKLVRSYGDRTDEVTSKFLKKIQGTRISKTDVVKGKKAASTAADQQKITPKDEEVHEDNDTSKEQKEAEISDDQQNEMKDEEKQGEVFEDVKDKAAAIVILKARGAKATDLSSNAAIKRFIKNQGFSFPNLVL